MSEGSEGLGSWREVVSDEGRSYFYNQITRETSWTKPPHSHAPDDAPKRCWRECMHEGAKYYWNELTGESTWSRPDEHSIIAPLPLWREVVREGRVYYYNETSKESSWTRPPESQLYQPPPPPSTAEIAYSSTPYPLAPPAHPYDPSAYAYPADPTAYGYTAGYGLAMPEYMTAAQSEYGATASYAYDQFKSQKAPEEPPEPGGKLFVLRKVCAALAFSPAP